MDPNSRLIAMGAGGGPAGEPYWYRVYTSGSYSICPLAYNSTHKKFIWAAKNGSTYEAYTVLDSSGAITYAKQLTTSNFFGIPRTAGAVITSTGRVAVCGSWQDNNVNGFAIVLGSDGTTLDTKTHRAGSTFNNQNWQILEVPGFQYKVIGSTDQITKIKFSYLQGIESGSADLTPATRILSSTDGLNSSGDMRSCYLNNGNSFIFASQRKNNDAGVLIRYNASTEAISAVSLAISSSMPTTASYPGDANFYVIYKSGNSATVQMIRASDMSVQAQRDFSLAGTFSQSSLSIAVDADSVYATAGGHLFKLDKTSLVNTWQRQFQYNSSGLTPEVGDIVLVGNAVYLTFYTGGSSVLLKVPKDGTRTGTYGNLSYAASSLSTSGAGGVWSSYTVTLASTPAISNTSASSTISDSSLSTLISL